ncbi:hypothetical protein [Lichenihabitans psoromatis]|uniref:hypothetical protein n=1 Tax=Lichenihabitans psoromatis TaxID=2528642 RepID=UPI001035C983|nr:hypothetical protein [Lichenihabitans psoromatis]
MLFLLDLVFPFALLTAWAIAWFAVIHPWLLAYRWTAGLTAEIDAREYSALTWILLRLKGLRTALMLFVASLIGGFWDLIQTVLGVDPSALSPFQDTLLWKAVLQDDIAIKAAGLAAFASALLVLHGKLKDVRTVPRNDPAPSGAISTEAR